MSAKDKRIERGQRFRRFRRGENRRRGVSPVVATLILILIAVAAAAALYLWLVVWQGSVTSGIGSPGAQYTVTIGGSTSVYPFDTYAVTQFEQNNSDVAVSNNEGGSGAGMLSVCSGQVDIGTASAEEALATLEAPISTGGYGCPLTPVPTEQTVAYDAVDVIVPAADPHGLGNISADTLLTIYIANGGGYSAFTASGAKLPGDYPTYPQLGGVSWPGTIGTSGIAWDQIPACVANSYFKCAGNSISSPEEPLNTTVATAATVGYAAFGSFNTKVAQPYTTTTDPITTITAKGYYTENAMAYFPAPAEKSITYVAAPTVTPSAGTTVTSYWPWENITNENYVSANGGTLFVNFTVPFEVTAITNPATFSVNTAGDVEVGFQEATNVGTGGTACGSDICQFAAPPVASPCGWTVCAGGSGSSPATDVIQQWGRADSSGTEQSFTARILGIGDSAGSTAGLAYTGCSPDGQLASCGINPPASQLGQGNPLVISGVAAHPDAIGFASDGLARLAGSGVSCDSSTAPCIGLEAVGQTKAVVPTTGSSGTIAAGILGSGAATTQYQGWRPFEYWTLGAPSGEVARFINFVEDPANNQAFANEAAEVSVYSI